MWAVNVAVFKTYDAAVTSALVALFILFGLVRRVPHMFHMLIGTHRLPWRVSAIEQESELLGHLNG